jgi:ubiquinone/menaquinone biosynthesis C-methylase UbiE
MSVSHLHFYGALARWWPAISPLEDYAEEGAWAARLVQGAADGPVRSLLELGSGGGHMAWQLKKGLPGCELVLSDLSEQMLTVSRELLPGVEHVQGDMRELRLTRRFDRVFVHDAVDYMCTVEDIDQLLQTAVAHLEVGGAVVLIPDHMREDWEPDEDVDGRDLPDGRALRYMEWSWDPDPEDSWVQTEYAFVFREADGRIWSHHESHRTGLFPLALWLERMVEAGLETRVVLEETSEDRSPRKALVGRYPGPSSGPPLS